MSTTTVGTQKIKKLLSKEQLKKHYDMMNDNLKKQLMHKNNYKVFYWAPDYSFCGFAPSE